MSHRDFVEFRYPDLEPRAQLQRARVLYSYICSKTAPPLEDYRTRRDRGIDFNTWCVYCFEDEPLLMVYACTLQHVSSVHNVNLSHACKYTVRRGI